jgi:hypothetical protein
MDLSKLTMGESTFGLTMPILLLLLFTAIAGGIVIALGGTRRRLWAIILGTVILLICTYCLFLACNTVLHAKKTVMVNIFPITAIS